MVLPLEVWKEFKPYYLISNLGRVRRLAHYYYRTEGNKEIKSYLPERTYTPNALNAKGYPRVNIYGKVYFIHTLVAKLFITNPLGKKQVNHINGNKLDNTTNNLEWVTNKENRDHAVKHKLHSFGERSHSKLSNSDVKTIRKLYKQGMFQRTIGAKFGLSQQAVCHIVNRITWKHI